jgi:hypothetical protein
VAFAHGKEDEYEPSRHKPRSATAHTISAASTIRAIEIDAYSSASVADWMAKFEKEFLAGRRVAT